MFFPLIKKKHLKLREEIATQMSRPKNVCVYTGYIHILLCVRSTVQ